MTLVADASSEPTAGDLISIPEAARRLGLHPETLYRLCRRGQFSPAIQIGKRWRVSVPRLGRYLHGDDFDLLSSKAAKPTTTASISLGCCAYERCAPSQPDHSIEHMFGQEDRGTQEDQGSANSAARG